MSDAKKSPDEKPKKKIAHDVVTPKHLYFVPSASKSIEADSLDEAVAALDNEADEQRKDGDE